MTPDKKRKANEFKVVEGGWRSWISKEEGAKFPPEDGRYHLFVAFACPFAHRAMLARAVKGLENSISVTTLHPVSQKTRPGVDDHKGWCFGDPDGKEPWTNPEGLGGPFLPAYPGNEPDPFFGFKTIREYYEHVGDMNGVRSVPVLWDKKLKTFVSNESAEILRMINSEFNDFAKVPELDLYPEDLREEIDKVNSWVGPALNMGVYGCGFAKTQEAYDKAIVALTDAFDRVEEILKKQRYIVGDRFTEADIRLFVTLLRFDEAYIVFLKTNTRSVATTPTILNYCREIYQMPGVKETIDMEQIKLHYYCSFPIFNHYAIVPKGGETIKLLEEPHNRDSIFKGKDSLEG